MADLTAREAFQRKLRDSLNRAAKVRRGMAELKDAKTTPASEVPVSQRSRDVMHSLAKAR